MSLPINLLITTLLIYVVGAFISPRSETERTTFNQYIRRDRCTCCEVVHETSISSDR